MGILMSRAYEGSDRAAAPPRATAARKRMVLGLAKFERPVGGLGKSVATFIVQAFSPCLAHAPTANIEEIVQDRCRIRDLGAYAGGL